MIWLIIAAVVVILLVLFVIGTAFYMVNNTLKRKAPVVIDDVSVLGKDADLNDFVRDAVPWLETGELMEQVSYDGLKLYGRFLKNDNSHVYAICCHGYKNHRMQDISNQAKHFYEMGYNVFCAHARGHGRSEGNYIGMGSHERRDIVGWIEKLIDMDPDAKMFLYGVSMGGATVMTTSGENLPDNVKCAIEDCGFSSPWDEFSFHLGHVFHLPVRPILDVCQVISERRYGLRFHEFSAKEQIKKTSLPFLFIHGDLDTFVPYSMMQPLFESCASKEKKAVTITGAEHAEAYWKDPDTYWSEIESWLQRYL